MRGILHHTYIECPICGKDLVIYSDDRTQGTGGELDIGEYAYPKFAGECYEGCQFMGVLDCTEQPEESEKKVVNWCFIKRFIPYTMEQEVDLQRDPETIEEFNSLKSLEVSSYNLHSAKDSSHPDYDTSHDGSVITLLCIDSNGEEFLQNWSGD